MPTQWSEAEQVLLGCIAPRSPKIPPYGVRADVGIGPYETAKTLSSRHNHIYPKET